MAVRSLPRKANLDHLRNESREFQRLVRAGDTPAIADLREHHPHRADTAASLVLADAQHVVARRYGFASWDRLRRFLEDVHRHTRRPGDAALDGNLASRFLQLACLTYGGDDRSRHVEAHQILAANPAVGTTDIYTMAAAGEVLAAQALLADDPGAATREGGPHRWEPLLYAAYSRVEATDPARSTLAVARLLLDNGADPNAGYLWDGQCPFTALTGAFGGGEDKSNQPQHHDAVAFARLLLDTGADPNDTQALYNRMFWPDNSHLELLFEFGLGVRTPTVWADRLGPKAMPIPAALAMNLQWAAEYDFVDRVELLLDHGIDPNAESGHPVFHGRSPCELADRAGNQEIVRVLLAAGAEHHELDPAARLVATCLRGDRVAATALVAADPGIVPLAEVRHAPLQRAAELGRLAAVALMVDLGFNVNALGRTTALHQAATTGNLALVEALIAMGADPSIRDRSFDATPQGWAHHHGHEEVAAYLEQQME